MYRKLIFVFFAVTVSQAQDLSGGNSGTNVELSTGYQAATMADMRLRPQGSAFFYGGAKMSQTGANQPVQVYQEDKQATTYISSGLSQLAGLVGLSDTKSAGYFAAGGAAALASYYLYSIFNLSASKKMLGKLASSLPGASKKKSSTTDETKSDDEANDKDSDKAKSRRRRAIAYDQDNERLTELAAIVLNAVRSGECLQKTICQVGKQVSNGRGRLTDSLLSTLLPASVQQSDYYIVLKRSLRGELKCEKFRCPT